MTAPAAPVPIGRGLLDDGAAYETTYRVRFDEAGPNGVLRTSCYLRYAQDVAWLHSTALGFDRAWYAERGVAWLVRTVALTVLAEVPLGTVVTARTAVVGQRRVWAQRRGDFRLPDGRLAGTVDTWWVLIDGRGAPTRIPDAFKEIFHIPEAPGQIRRVDLTPAPTTAPSRPLIVRPHELDPMDHANNAVYVDWLEEAVLAADPVAGPAALAAVPRGYTMEYAMPADAGAALDGLAWPDQPQPAADPPASAPGWHYRLTPSGGGQVVFRAILDGGPGKGGNG